MSILFSDVKFSEADTIDFSDDTLNGHGKGVVLENDKINNIFPEVSATERQQGDVKRAKVFLTNDSDDRKMQSALLHIKQDVLVPDEMILYAATESDHYEFDNIVALSGETSTVVAGTSIEVGNLAPAGTVTNDLIGREFYVGSLLCNVDTAPDATHITFAEDITEDVDANYTIKTADDFDHTESDEDFTTAKKHSNVMISQSVANASSEVRIPASQEDRFEVDDFILITNEYYQVVFRGKVDSKAIDSADNSLWIITLDNPYYGNTIPVLKGSICLGLSFELESKRTKSFWLEMNIQSEASIQAEIISQFQIGIHFDDVTDN